MVEREGLPGGAVLGSDIPGDLEGALESIAEALHRDSGTLSP